MPDTDTIMELIHPGEILLDTWRTGRARQALVCLARFERLPLRLPVANRGRITTVIIAVEGPSAAGKTRWCQANGTLFVPEYQQTGSESDGVDLAEQAMYWVGVNSSRWAAAERIEATSGIAVCDSDPLKLHYSWCLARIGADSIERFEHELSAVRQAFLERSLGFADCVFVSVPPASQLKAHKENDPTRRRRHFELHAALSDSLAEWYSTIDALDPGRVTWEFPSLLNQRVLASPRTDRSDVRFLEAVIGELPDLRR